MKNLKVLLLLIFAMLVLGSCMKDDLENIQYYWTIGMLNISGDSTFIDSDSGVLMYVLNDDLVEGIDDGDRVYVNFSMVEQELPAGVDYVIEISDIEEILFKEIFVYDSISSDTIGNVEIIVNELYIIKDILNLNFDFQGGKVKHDINLARPEGLIPTDTVDLEIRHNSNGDIPTEWFRAFVSFDLISLKNEIADSVVLRIKANDYNTDSFEKILTYKY